MNGYRAPWWLPGRHLQTLVPSLIPWPWITYTRERWPTPDGRDFIDVHWAGPENAPRLLVLFHGLEGNSAGAYARRIGAEALRRGWRFAVPHFRGCSVELNRALTDYHAGASDEVDWILREFRKRHGHLYAAGVSLGDNALLKGLGEPGAAAGDVVRGAVAVSAPFDLSVTGAVLGRGFSRLYGKHFLANNLRWKALRKLEPDMFPGAYDRCRVNKASVLSEFEDAVTAPVNGFLDAHDYWARSSAGQFFNRIAVDTLALNARNDPFLPDHVLRGAERRRALIPPNVQFEFPAEGGHAGFADGAGWLGNRVADFLAPL